jgi:hypothetical protein
VRDQASCCFGRIVGTVAVVLESPLGTSVDENLIPHASLFERVEKSRKSKGL